MCDVYIFFLRIKYALMQYFCEQKQNHNIGKIRIVGYDVAL